MKIFPVSFIVVAALVTVIQPVKAESAVTVRDFIVSPFDYGYEEWKDLGTAQTKTPGGVAIKGSAKGGVGAFFNDPVDISSNTQLEIKVKRGVSNTEDSLLLKLVSADGKSSTWKIPLGTVSATDFTVIKLELSTARGVKDAVDLETIKQLQIQGTFNPTTAVDFEIASITATGSYTPPATGSAPPPSAK